MKAIYNKRPLINAFIATLLVLISTLSIPHSVYAASATVTPDTGVVGSTVVISGNGFSGSLATIHWDGQVVAEKVPISESGAIDFELQVPNGIMGDHTLFIDDDSNWEASTATLDFTVIPGIKITPKMGPIWSKISIIGAGFPAREEGISIIWDDEEPIVTSAAADNSGRWTADIDVTNVPQGEHTISARSNSISAEQIGKVPFTVVPWATMEPTSGPVGTKVKISAWGFITSEDGVTFTFDNVIILTNVTAEANGRVITDGTMRPDGQQRPHLIIPETVQGIHEIGIYGSSFTPKGTFPSFDFEVIPSIVVEPSFGKQGTHTFIAGNGFSANDPITIKFDTMIVKDDLVTSDKGSFECTYIVPQTTNTEHTITVESASGDILEAPFTTEKTVTTDISLLSPGNTTGIELFSSVGQVLSGGIKYFAGIGKYLKGTDKVLYTFTPVKFDWSDAHGIDNIRYVIEFTNVEDPYRPVLSRIVVGNSEYTLTEEDALMVGNYRWKVGIINSAGEVDEWSEDRTFTVSSMPTRVSILSIVIIVLILAAIIFAILTIRANVINR
jgi:hypothetical protein